MAFAGICCEDHTSIIHIIHHTRVLQKYWYRCKILITVWWCWLVFKKIEIAPDVWYSGCSTGWMVYCASSSDSFGLGLLVFSLKSLIVRIFVIVCISLSYCEYFVIFYFTLSAMTFEETMLMITQGYHCRCCLFFSPIIYGCLFLFDVCCKCRFRGMTELSSC